MAHRSAGIDAAAEPRGREHSKIIVDYNSMADSILIEVRNFTYPEDVKERLHFNLLGRRWSMIYHVVFKTTFDDSESCSPTPFWGGGKLSRVHQFEVLLCNLEKTPIEARIITTISARDQKEGRPFHAEGYCQATLNPVSNSENTSEYCTVFDTPVMEAKVPSGNFTIKLKLEWLNSKRLLEHHFKDGAATEVPRSSLATDWLRLYNEKRQADVTFVVEGKEVQAHRLVFAARCGVPLLHESMAEGKQNARVQISDTSFEVFEMFLKFLYTDTVSNEDLAAQDIELLKIADKYGMERLIKICQCHILKTLSVINVFDYLQVAVERELLSLLEPCKHIIHSNLTEAMQTEAWGKLKTLNPQLAFELVEGCLGVTNAQTPKKKRRIT